jgi:prepilin-type processing-associated H-X9-DG protein
VLGILSILLPPLAVPTIICGHIARSKARTRGGAGSEPALVGLVLGYVAIVIAVAFYVACMALMASLELAGERARRITCNGRLNQVGKALRIYSSDFGGHFPPGDGADGLRVLLECGYLKSPDLLVCPSTGTRPARDAASFGEENCDYVYEGGHTEAEPGDTTPLAWDRSGNHKNMGNILYVDGHVKGFAGPDWRKNLRRK